MEKLSFEQGSNINKSEFPIKELVEEVSTPIIRSESGSVVSAKELEAQGLYERFGVTPNADDREIKKAYRAAARKLHPDLNNGQTDRQMQILNETKEILLDPSRRVQYDQARPNIENVSAKTQESEPENVSSDTSYKSYSKSSRNFYGFESGGMYEAPFTMRESDFENFFEKGFGVAKADGKYYGINAENFAITRPYELIFKLGIHRIAKQEALVYLLNAIAQELSAPYGEFRLEGEYLVGHSNNKDYLINPKDGSELSLGFDKIEFENQILTGKDNGKNYELNGITGKIITELI